ncbi:MAG TPA: endopeptidase La [Thermotogota bacterium]|nr:endopeptidase La [Thermotogota bacterium]
MSKFQKLEEFASDGKESIEIPGDLPLIPMRTNMLVYPGSVMPFYVGRDKSLNALEESIEKKNRLIFLVAQKNPGLENPATEDLFEVGVVAQIMQLMKLPDGSFKVLVEGLVRAQRLDALENEEFFSTEIEVMVPRYKRTKTLEVFIRRVKEDTRKYFHMTKKLPPEALQALEDTSDADKFADFVSSVLPLGLEEKQVLLETVHPRERMEQLIKILARELELMKMEEDLEKKVRSKLEQSQKEYYLREKMKTIKEELEGSGDAEIVEYRERIAQGDFPDNVKEKATHEVDRLEKSPAFSAEATVIRTYLDWLLELPWNVESEDKIDVKEARKILDRDHYGLEEVKERILEYLAARVFSRGLKAPILCLVGPPGVGKTSLGQSLANSMNRKFVRMSLGGMRDEAEIRGHRRTYVGALPGRIMQLVKNAGVRNPLILLDEIDKLGISFQGDPAAALLEVLDPQQNNSFVDHFLEVPFDLSKVIFVTTANVLHTIPPALRDRMEVIEIPGYTDVDKLHIAREHLIPTILDEHKMKKALKFSTPAIQEIIHGYTREAGVRNLQREIASIVRKAALKLLESGNKTMSLGKRQVTDLLGPARFLGEEKLETPEVGIAMGLAWTAVGGTVLQIESLFLPGKGNLLLTGQLGEVMKESAKIALSIARHKCGQMDQGFFDHHDLHLHVPEGAVPKDGPSAGITMATSLVSAIEGLPVRNDIAMTGELTLRGKVLAIGGVREKTLAAYRVGIHEVLLPLENKKDVQKIPEEVQKKMTFHFVENMDQVLKIALVGSKC